MPSGFQDGHSWYTSGYMAQDAHIQTRFYYILSKTEINITLQERTKMGLVICGNKEIQDSTGKFKPGELQK